MKKSTNINTTTMNKSANAKTLYVIFTVVVVGLIFLIGWFAYLLWQPDEEATPSNTNTTNVSNVNTKNSNKNTNAGLTNKANSNENENDNTNSDDEDEGLVEPDEDENDNDNENTNSDDEDGADSEAEGETETLYFASSGSSCGETVAVKRPLTLGDDPYGEIILSMMAGPEDGEDGVDGIPSTVRLRQVQYTSNGPLITVGEGYNDLSDCEKKTVDAQFIETANAMFDLPAGTDGEVVVGEVAADDTEETEEDSSTEE